MAVKPEKIKERLKALWPKANLSTKRLDALAAKLATKPADDADDAAVDAVLNDANDFMSFEDIAKEDDRVRTLEASQKKPEDKKDDKPEDKKDENLSETEKLLKGLTDTIGKLSTDIAEIKSGKITDSKKTVAQTKFEASEVFKTMKPEIKAKWLERIQSGVTTETTDDQIDGFIKDYETEYSDLTQHIADTSTISGLPPGGGRAETKPSDEDVAAVVANM